MMRIKTAVDYRAFRLNKLNTSEYAHLKLLLFWPLFGLAFLCAERFSTRTVYHPIACPLDDMIPFHEAFLIPYLFWFLFLAGMLLYTLLFDIPAFSKMMRFIMLTYTFALVVYLLYPNCQNLRPQAFERDNFLTAVMAWFYRFDTNTNVCPSIHVIGSVAVAFAAGATKRFSSRGWQAVFWAAAALISISTVFVKQHSIIDVIAAVPVCVAAYYLCFREKRPVKPGGEAET